ncbi:unnamed protein product [[Candida] boidinii]|uniref:Unnamed protein product n=1 Tax=Candida boidinii TaxID=5477 RepID=A0A9W6W7Y1_CANBO|nr:hypothetical protein B5S30_g4962 [[Candida] boidinii]GME67602.1 unnamed protein product [[Candida] boidinii]
MFRILARQGLRGGKPLQLANVSIASGFTRPTLLHSIQAQAQLQKSNFNFGLSKVRFNSTNAAATAATTTAATAETTTEAATKFETSLSGFDDVVDKIDMTSDQLGYLQSVGLAQGWWPSDIMQTIFEYVHVFSGLPWWATIVVTTLGVRLALFPLFVKSSDAMARSAAVQPESKKLRKELNIATARGDQRLRNVKMLELRELNKKNGIKMTHLFIAPATQITYGIGTFFGIREMCNKPVQGFDTQGYAWFQDLTATDPYIGLQLISAAVYMVSFRLGGDSGVNNFSPAMRKVFQFLPLASIVFTWNLSSGVVLYFAANGIASIIQANVLKSKSFRKWVGMAPLVPPRKDADGESKGIFESFSETMKDMEDGNKAKRDIELKAKKAADLQLARARGSKVVIKKRK